MSSAAATIAQTFEQQARKYGARAFLKEKHEKTWHDHSWTSINDRVMRLRGGLARLGIKPGNRVAILAENGPHWVVFDLATREQSGAGTRRTPKALRAKASTVFVARESMLNAMKKRATIRPSLR